MSKSIGLNFRGVRTVYHGEVAEFPVEVSPARMDASRAARLARELGARLHRDVVLGEAELTLHVGKSAQVPFLGLAEGNGTGSAAFVNLDGSASDELILEVAAHEAGHLLGTVRHAGEGLAACAYTNPTSAANYHLKPTGTDPGAVTLALDTMWPTEPYAKQMVVSANTVVGTIVQSGGQLYLSSGAVGSNVSVYGGGGAGTLTSRNATVIVHSGSILRNVYLSNTQYNYNTNIQIYNTGVLSGADVKWGRILVMAGGTAYDVKDSGSLHVYGYASGGHIAAGELIVDAGGLVENMTVKGGGAYLRGGTMKTNAQQTGGTYHVSSGGQLHLTEGAVTNNVIIYSGGQMHVSGGAIGGNINMSATTELFVSNGGTVDGLHTSASTAVASAVGATINNLDIKAGYLRTQNSVISGGTVTGGGVSAGVHGATGDASYVNDVTINGGNIWLFDHASATNITVTNGSFQFWGGKRVENVTVANKAIISANTTVTAMNFTVAAGGRIVTAGNFIWGGDTNIDNGAKIEKNGGNVTTFGENFKGENGVFTGLSVTDINFQIASGAKIVDGEAAGTANVRVYDGGTVEGFTVNDGGQLVLSGGSKAVASDVVVNEGGKIAGLQGAQAHNFDVKAGAIVYNTSMFVWYGDNTQIAEGVVADYGATAKAENGVFTNVELSRTLRIGSDVKVNGGSVVSSGGSLAVYANALAEGTLIDKGYINVYDGGVASDITIRGSNSAETLAYGFIYSGGLLSHFTVSNAGGRWNSQLFVSSGGTIKDGEIVKGRIQISAGGEGYNINTRDQGSIYNWGTIYDGLATGGETQASSGGLFLRETVDGGALYARGGTFSSTTARGGTIHVSKGGLVKDTVMVTGVEMHASTGGTIDGVTMSGGNIYVSGGGLARNVNVTPDENIIGLVTVYNGGTVEDLNIRGTIYKAQVNISNGGLVRDLKLSGTANVYNGGVLSGALVGKNGIFVEDGATAYDVVVSNAGASMRVSRTGVVSNATAASGGYVLAINGGTIDGVTLLSSGYGYASAGGTLSGVVMNEGGARLHDYGTVRGVSATIGNINVHSGGVLSGAVFGGSAYLTVMGSGVASNVVFHSAAERTVAYMTISGGALVEGLRTQTYGATVFAEGALRGLENNGAFVRARNGGSISGGWTTSGEVWASAGGTVSGHTLYTSRANIYVMNAGVASDSVLSGGRLFLRGGNASGVTIYDGYAKTFDTRTTLVGGTLDGVVLSGGSLRVESGAAMNVEAAGGVIEVAAGATLTNVTALGDTAIDIDFTGVEDPATAMIDSFAQVAETVAVSVTGIGAAGTYALAGAGSVSGVTVKAGLYDDAVATGATYTNATTGLTYGFDGKNVTATALNLAAKSTAAALSTADTAINGSDRAAKWDATTTYAGSVALASDAIDGDAWLVIDGADVSSALYGASGAFANTVNIAAKSGTIRNLAAGAAAGGTVGGVNLTVDGADFTGTAYAGGFGSVAGETNTLLAAGTFSKDFYAGALANKNAAATSVGDVNLTVEGGTFAGNLYGASAVKTAATVGSGIRHTAGDVTLTLAGGSTTNAKFCAFAGGYATGDATGTVYTVDSVTVEVADGVWGDAEFDEEGALVSLTPYGGRGLFGGTFASGVTSEVLAGVDITVTGGVIGNVFGGGWAQKGGNSVVGDVNITIEGGTIGNVFGGGSHSVDGAKGTTSVDNVDIVVSGGTITGSIFAKGQAEGDAVNGTATVTFTGYRLSRTIDCNVYGYSYVGDTSAVSEALNFTDFAGTLTGSIGGFAEVNLTGMTELTLAGAEDASISNSAWNFDVAGRSDLVAGDALLTWSDADFSADSITLKLTDAVAVDAWTLIAGGAETAYNTGEGKFAVEIGDAVSALTFNAETGMTDAISGGAYDGWGFALEDSVLKFKNLA